MGVHSFYVLGPDPDSVSVINYRDALKRLGGDIKLSERIDEKVRIGLVMAIVAVDVIFNEWMSHRARTGRDKVLWRCEYCFKQTAATGRKIAAMPTWEAECNVGRKVGLWERIGSGLMSPTYDCRSAIDKKAWPKWIFKLSGKEER